MKAGEHTVVQKTVAMFVTFHLLSL